MRDIGRHDEAVTVRGTGRTLTYRPRRVDLDDGTTVAHESRGGTLASVWATDLGDRYVEVVHLGDGPAGGELVLVVPDADLVVVGDLVTAGSPAEVPAAWPATLELVLGLIGEHTTIWTSAGTATRDDVIDLGRRLMEQAHG